MGNCKSTSHSKIESSTSAIKAQKTIEKKHKKSMRSFLRTVLLAKKRSDSKISPATSNSGTIGNDSPTVQNPATPEQQPTKNLQAVFCESDNATITCEEVESPSFSDIVQDAEDSSYVVSEKIAKLRKGRFSEHYLRGLNQVSELKEKLEVLNESQKRRKMLLTALKARALLSSHDPLRKAELNVSIEKLTKSYCRYERKLYRMKAERAVVQAKVDYFLLKLSPKLKYTDIYAKTDSSYLSPIPEESEDELEDLQ